MKSSCWRHSLDFIQPASRTGPVTGPPGGPNAWRRGLGGIRLSLGQPAANDDRAFGAPCAAICTAFCVSPSSLPARVSGEYAKDIDSESTYRKDPGHFSMECRFGCLRRRPRSRGRIGSSGRLLSAMKRMPPRGTAAPLTLRRLFRWRQEPVEPTREAISTPFSSGSQRGDARRSVG